MKFESIRAIAAVALTFTVAATVLAQTAAPGAARMAFPTQPIKWLIPYAPGGAVDSVARDLAVRMGADLGQPMVLENRPGASTMIMATAVARAAPDGYTIGSADTGTLAFNPSLYSNIPYDVSKSFSMIGGIGKLPMVLVVNPAFPAKDMKELLEMARASPGKISFASAGAGSPMHMALELFKQSSKADVMHVPYKGAAPALADVMGGQVNAAFVDLPPSIGMIKSGRLRVLAVGAPERLAILPEVPTVAQAGLPGFEAYAWQGMIGPANLPQDVVDRLNKSLATALANPEVVARLRDMGVQPMPLSPVEFANFAALEQKRWAEVIKAAGIKLEQ